MLSTFEPSEALLVGFESTRFRHSRREVVSRARRAVIQYAISFLTLMVMKIRNGGPLVVLFGVRSPTCPRKSVKVFVILKLALCH